MVKALLKKESFDCPDCGEVLKLLPGTARDSEDPTTVAAAYACKDCNIGLALIDGNISYAPWDAKGKRLPEIHCKTCNKASVYRQQFINILEETMFYDQYCPDCAIEYLRNNLAEPDKREKITIENVEGMADLHSVIVSNRVLSDPEKYRKVLEDSRMKTALKGLGITDEMIARRAAK